MKKQYPTFALMEDHREREVEEVKEGEGGRNLYRKRKEKPTRKVI